MFETEKRHVESRRDGDKDREGERQRVGLPLIFLLFFHVLTEISQGEVLRSSGDVLSGSYALVKEKRDPKEENRLFFPVKETPKFSFVLPILNHG